jgi:hypothetical protein
MSTHAISRTSSPVRLRARPVMASLALLTVLFVVFAVDVLRLQTDSVPGLLASRVVGPLVILGFLRLIHVPLREIGLHRRRVERHRWSADSRWCCCMRCYMRSTPGASPRLATSRIS